MDTNKRAGGFLIFLLGIVAIGACYAASWSIFSLPCVMGFLFFLGGLFIWDPARDGGEKP